MKSVETEMNYLCRICFDLNGEGGTRAEQSTLVSSVEWYFREEDFMIVFEPTPSSLSIAIPKYTLDYSYIYKQEKALLTRHGSLEATHCRAENRAR